MSPLKPKEKLFAFNNFNALTDILWRNADLALCKILIIMLKNQFKKPFHEEMNDNLEEMYQVLSDIGQATIQLNAKLKKYEDEASLRWLQTFEEKLFEVREKIEELSLSFKPILCDYMETINNCITVETKRIAHLKNLMVDKQAYQHTAQLRDIEKGIEELRILTKVENK